MVTAWHVSAARRVALAGSAVCEDEPDPLGLEHLKRVHHRYSIRNCGIRDLDLSPPIADALMRHDRMAARYGVSDEERICS